MGLLYFSSTPPSRVEIFPKQIHGHRGIGHGRLQMTRAAYLESGRGPQDVECRFNKECNAIKPGGLGYWEVCHQQTAEDKVSRSHSARQYPPHEPQTLELVDMTASIGERGMFFFKIPIITCSEASSHQLLPILFLVPLHQLLVLRAGYSLET